MASQNLDMLTFGSITLDIIVRVPEEAAEIDLENFQWCIPMGDKIHIEDMFVSMGGGSANTALGFSKLGLKTAAYGVMGDDAYKKFMLNEFKKGKVDTSHIVFDTKQDSHFSIILNSYTGHRTVFHRKTDLVCIPKSTVRKAPKAKALYTAHLYDTSEHLLWDVPYWKAHSEGIWAWNPGKTQFKQGMKKYKALFPAVDILILNREESEQFTGLSAKKMEIKGAGEDIFGKCIERPDMRTPAYLYDVRHIADKFLKAGIKKVVITDGDRGAQGFTKDEHHYMPSLDVERVDTLGAGDAFSVGVIAAHLHGKDFCTQLSWGGQNASSVMTAHGAGNGQLSLKEIAA